MAVAQVNGTAYFYGNIRKSVDTGVIKHAGNLADTTRWTNRALDANRVDSAYLLKEGLGTAKALSSGTFAYLQADKYIIRRHTTTLSGVANTTLRSGGSDFGNRHAIHKSERARTTFLSGLQWTTATDLPAYTLTETDQDITYSNDHAARPSLAVPGELTYRNGSLTPVQDEYEAKTLG